MYDVEILPRAERELKHLDSPISQRIRQRLRWLAEHFAELEPAPLTGEWAGFFKFRVGDYRVIYRVLHAQQLLVVHRVQHRREVYE